MDIRIGIAHSLHPVSGRTAGSLSRAHPTLSPTPDLVEDIDPGILPWGLGTVSERCATDLPGGHQPSPTRPWFP